MRIAVTGAGGQLGAAIVHEFSNTPGHEVRAFTRAQLDVTDAAAVNAAMSATRPDVIVNCTAYNDVDAAEDRPIDALNTNAFGVRTLAAAADRLDAILVHYGSDFVFDGTATEPYREEAPPSPRSVYAASKMLGEWFALDAARGYVLRVESLFGRAPGGPARGSIATIANGLLAGSTPTVFEDRVVSPTYVADAARATRALVERGAAPGLYHCVNSGSCTWYELAVELAGLLGVEPKLKPLKMSELKLRAQRPLYSALSNEKLRQAGVEMQTWQQALACYAREVTTAPSRSIG